MNEKPIPTIVPEPEGDLAVTSGATINPSKGSTTLIIGDIGVGKTHAIRTWIAQGITPFVLALEPGIASTLGDLPAGSWHMKYIAPGVSSWADMKQSAKLINSSPLRAIAEMGDIKKTAFPQYMQVLDACSNFVCDLDGKSYGAIDSWGSDRVFIVDTLSGFNTICMKAIIGSKPVASMLDWQCAQNINMQFLGALLNATMCHIVVNAHSEKEPNELLGVSQIMASSLGKKLAPILVRDFDNVILADRDKTGTPLWATRASNARLKSRHLPLTDSLPQDFGLIVKDWKAKGGVITASPSPL